MTIWKWLSWPREYYQCYLCRQVQLLIPAVLLTSLTTPRAIQINARLWPCSLRQSFCKNLIVGRSGRFVAVKETKTNSSNMLQRSKIIRTGSVVGLQHILVWRNDDGEVNNIEDSSSQVILECGHKDCSITRCYRIIECCHFELLHKSCKRSLRNLNGRQCHCCHWKGCQRRWLR